MTSTTAPDPRRGLGALGERLAAEHLERAGYTLIERNYRSRFGEIDVAARGRALVFCEVKTRVSGGTRGPAGPLDVDRDPKRRRLRRLAREWLSAHAGRGPYAPTCASTRSA